VDDVGYLPQLVARQLGLLRHGSTVVWYIVSLEFVNGEFMYVYKLSSILYMDMLSVSSCSCVGRPHPFLHASSVQCLTLVSIHSQ